MKNRSFLLAAMVWLFASLLFVSCTEVVSPVEIDETLLVGKWQNEANMQEYWRYDRDEANDSGGIHDGETWDESEDVQEGEGTKFKWSVNGDQLQLDLYGEMGQHVYYDYTVTLQTSSRLEWKDLYGNKQKFVKSFS